MNTSHLPLAGIKVVEISHMVMGPTCAMILADLGADVIKVEPKKGDNTRRLLGSGAGFFRTFNRNKRSVALDTDTPEGLDALQKLASTADVFVENFRPGRMQALGVDYESLKAKNPALIYVSHKGFLRGPYEDRLALDEVVQMMGGLAYMTGPIGRPLRAGSSVNDIMGGMFGAIGAIAALYQRKTTGAGQEIQSALFENCVMLAAQHMQQYAVTGEAAAPMPERIQAWAIYDVFQLSEGQQMFIAATGDQQWCALCKVLTCEELITHPLLATNNDRVRARDWLLPIIANKVALHESTELARQLEAVKVPFAAIVRPEDLFTDEHLLKSGGLADLTLEDGGKTQVPLLPIAMNGVRLAPRMAIPAIGEQTRDVLKEIGFTDTEIEKLQMG